MVQREVAERMISPPGSKSYGAMSVAVQFRAEPKIIFDVPPNAFLPRPEVTSSVVVCDVRKSPVEVSDEKFFVKVVRGAFNQRRKTLYNSLAGAGFLKEKIFKAFEAANIQAERRAETLSIEEFARLADELKKVSAND